MKNINIKDLSKEQIKELEEKPTPEERFLQLIDVNNMVKKRDFEEYPETADFWIANGEIIAEHLKNGDLWIDYSKIWSVLESEYSYNYNQVKELIKNTVEEHFNLKGVTPEYQFPSLRDWWNNTLI